MAKQWGQPKGAKQDAEVEGGAATNDKLYRTGTRDPHGDYAGAVSRTDEGIGEGSVAPAAGVDTDAADAAASAERAAARAPAPAAAPARAAAKARGRK